MYQWKMTEKTLKRMHAQVLFLFKNENYQNYFGNVFPRYNRNDKEPAKYAPFLDSVLRRYVSWLLKKLVAAAV